MKNLSSDDAAYGLTPFSIRPNWVFILRFSFPLRSTSNVVSLMPTLCEPLFLPPLTPRSPYSSGFGKCEERTTFAVMSKTSKAGSDQYRSSHGGKTRRRENRGVSALRFIFFLFLPNSNPGSPPMIETDVSQVFQSSLFCESITHPQYPP